MATRDVSPIRAVSTCVDGRNASDFNPPRKVSPAVLTALAMSRSGTAHPTKPCTLERGVDTQALGHLPAVPHGVDVGSAELSQPALS